MPGTRWGPTRGTDRYNNDLFVNSISLGVPAGNPSVNALPVPSVAPIPMSYCNILAKDYNRQSVLEAIKARHVYGATDNILADFRVGNHIMGDAFTTTTPPELKVKLQGTGNFKKVYVVKNNKYVYTLDPGKPTVEFTWRDNEAAKGTSFYYIRGEQEDENIVWVSPMWISY
jgi:hypothetical protein